MHHEHLDLDAVAATVVPFIEAAGAQIRTHVSSAAQRKDDGTLVTATDLAVDRDLTERLHAAYPQVDLLSEEHGQVYGGEPWCWVLDPVDGTLNFAYGLPIWGISLALLRAGEPVLGVLHFPMFERTYTALEGRGARSNGAPIRAASREYEGPPVVSFCSRSYARWQLPSEYKPRILGATAYNFALVASGAAVASSDLGVGVWDIAAGDLLVREAGGVVRYFDAPGPFPLQPGCDYRQQRFSCMAAIDTATADAVMGALVER